MARHTAVEHSSASNKCQGGSGPLWPSFSVTRHKARKECSKSTQPSDFFIRETTPLTPSSSIRALASPVRAGGRAFRITLPQLRVARKGDGRKVYAADKHSPGPYHGNEPLRAGYPGCWSAFRIPARLACSRLGGSKAMRQRPREATTAGQYAAEASSAPNIRWDQRTAQAEVSGEQPHTRIDI